MKFWQQYDFWFMLLSLLASIAAIVIAIKSYKVTKSIKSELPINWKQVNIDAFKQTILKRKLLFMNNPQLNNKKGYFIPVSLLTTKFNVNPQVIDKFERINFLQKSKLLIFASDKPVYIGRKGFVYLRTGKYEMDVFQLDGEKFLNEMNIDLQNYAVNNSNPQFFGDMSDWAFDYFKSLGVFECVEIQQKSINKN